MKKIPKNKKLPHNWELLRPQFQQDGKATTFKDKKRYNRKKDKKVIDEE